MRALSIFPLAAMAMLALATPVRGQLGTLRNPPPQNLFNLEQPPRLKNGLGTMTGPRNLLPRLKPARRIRLPPPS